nr:MotA/TolQ/ExbB proton channel family protein [Marichromatium bheemlicum]
MLRAGVSADRLDTHQRLRAAPLSYAIWVLPLMGFIGTVVGISGAIGGLGSVFGEAGREQALGEVLGHLRYAFDTTFVGLAAVIPIMALATFQRTLADRVRHQVVTHALRSATVEPRR